MLLRKDGTTKIEYCIFRSYLVVCICEGEVQVKLTEYVIRRIMLELSLCPDGIIGRVLGIYLRIGAFSFCFDSPIREFKYINLRRRN